MLPNGCPIGPRFEEALSLAVRIHQQDLRKSTSIPYLSHLFSVCALVMEDGGDEEEAIAALLHDALEDHPDQVSLAELEKRFGARVARLVAVCTDTPPDFKGGEKPPWRSRKTAYLERLTHEGYPTTRICLADKLHNTRAIVMDHRRLGDKVWQRFRASKADQLWYHRSLVEVFRAGGAPTHLVDELDSLVRELESRSAG